MNRFFGIWVLFLFVLVSCKSGEQESEMDHFIRQLMKQMTVEEKIGQLNLITPGGGVPTGAAVSTGVEEKIRAGKVGGIFGVTGPEKVRMAQELAVEHTRMKIPLLFGSDIIHGYKTIFPIPIGLSCSWDMDLIEKTARMAAVEATADGLNWNFSPMVDISRDPRWGRVSEGAGEDPFLGSEIARAMIRGYQGGDLADPRTLMATVKHLALYGAAEAGRDYNPVDMSRQTMFNYYLPPYKAAIEAGAGSVMSSFNDVEGIPATGNRWLLTGLLRDQWKFDGFVVSDYTSVSEMIDHGMGDLKEVSALALRAGLDMDMVSEGFLTTLQETLKEGEITENDIDVACRRVLEAKYKLGLFTDPYLYIDDTRPQVDILTPGNRHVAMDAAARSFVLLKNERNILPLAQEGTIALVGPLADNRNNMLGTWAVSGKPDMSVPVLEGIKNAVGEEVRIVYAKGANIHNDPEYAKKINVFGTRIDIDDRSPEVMMAEALTVASRSDVVVAVVGEASEMSGESSSRSDISIPESQKKLIRALKGTGKPLVLVLMTGRPLAMEEEYSLADAILLTWHPGIEAGNAIANVLFGNYNPSGKLTMSFPRNVGQIPVYYNHKNTGRPNPGDEFQKFRSNYLDVPNSPLFPFGYGLSYTTFTYSNLQLSQTDIQTEDTLTVSVEVTNTGNFSGEEVVQLYIRDMVASVTRPLKELKGFQKVFIEKGATERVIFKITGNDLAFYNHDLEFRPEPGHFRVYAGGDSSVEESVEFTLLE